MGDNQANPVTNDDEQPPAATIDLTPADARRALHTNSAERHGDLDECAEMSQGAAQVVSSATKNHHDLSPDDVAWDDAVGSCKTLVDDILSHVLEEHEHAVRWTLDPYDEMDDQPSGDAEGE